MMKTDNATKKKTNNSAAPRKASERRTGGQNVIRKDLWPQVEISNRLSLF